MTLLTDGDMQQLSNYIQSLSNFSFSMQNKMPADVEIFSLRFNTHETN